MDDGAEFYRKHRPQNFNELVGQTDAKKVLNEMGKRGEIPHAILIVGPTGTGKTTIARILRTKLKCSDHDYQELNAADFRGIDAIRAIRSQMSASPLGGKCRVWVLDECFPPGTEVDTPRGRSNIEDVTVGDSVCTMDGVSVVRRTFVNRVPIGNLVVVRFSDGTSQVTTRNHLFFTSDGWIPAERLFGRCVLCVRCYPAHKQELVHETERSSSDLSILRNSILEQETGGPEMLLEELCPDNATADDGQWDCGDTELRGVRESHQSYIESRIQETVLRTAVCGTEQKQTTRVPREVIHEGNRGEDNEGAEGLLPDTRWDRSDRSDVGADVYFESSQHAWCVGEDEGDKEAERDVACMEGGAGRQWEANSSTSCAVAGVAADHRLGLGVRGGDSYEGQRIWTPELLQSGHRMRDDICCDRGGREGSSVESRFIERSEKGDEVTRVRVVCVESYESGNNRGLFSGCVSSADVDRGYVEFHDLEIDGHPSYFVNGKAVHNCQSLTSDASDALLKLLEDTPKHVYFMLLTTDPQKLKKTVLSRCTEIKCKLLSVDELKEITKRVMIAEDVTLTDKVINRIAEAADGSGRKVLVILHSIIRLADEDAQLTAISSADVKSFAIDIARKLIDGRTSWKDMSALLKSIEDDAEGVRRAVMGYCKAVLLNGGSARAAMIMEEFRDPFYNNGVNDLVLACYNVIGSK